MLKVYWMVSEGASLDKLSAEEKKKVAPIVEVMGLTTLMKLHKAGGPIAKLPAGPFKYIVQVVY